MTDRQAALEALARERGVERMRTTTQRALEKDRASETVAGLDMLRRSLEPTANAIAEFLVNAELKRGPRPTLFNVCGHCDPYLLAYITGKVSIDRAAYGVTMIRCATAIGSAIEDEFRMAAFEEQQPRLYLTLLRSMRQRNTSPNHARAVWAKSATKAGVEIPRWAHQTKVHVGVTLFDMFANNTGMIERRLVWIGKGKSQWKVYLTEKSALWFADRNDKAGLLRPAYLPTVIEPAPWRGLRGGGYHTHDLFSLPFIKRTRPQHMDALKSADLSVTYAGLNAIQNTGWRVNLPVLGAMRHAWERSIPIKCLPKREDDPLPEKPNDIDTNPEARREWRAEAREVYAANTSTRGSRFEFARVLNTADEFSSDQRIFFPHQLDFRGRTYPVPAGLNPQGPDEAKSLLTFAEGKPLSDSGLWWLNVHGANVFGLDKVSMSERSAWGQDQWERAKATAADPYNDLWWTEADKPWAFLSWCYEVQRVTNGDGLSSLPIALDGSCNGLQHFSAMLRDPIGGRAVNLTPSDTPQDIYATVALRVLELLWADTGPSGWVARGWIDFGIDRKITKRPVMVLPYGGTRMAALKYVRDAVRERIRAGQENPFGDELSRAEVYLSGVVWRAIGDVVVAARTAMDWLQQVARVAVNYKMPLSWTTPSGFVAHQEYLSTKFRLIKTRSRGQIIRLTDYLEGNTLDRSKQALGISPNFVHSMDASAMMLTIREALGLGVKQFAMIHDSYGTVAADTDLLCQAIRRAFVDMYEQHDVLAEFSASVAATLPPEARHQIPRLPAKGNLDLQSVLKSDYFFA